MDYLGSADYLTSPVSGKVEAWTHYNEWGLIVHNAVLKCGQRELDLVKRYATHDYDSVLELYYAKARFYDAHDRRFTAVDPILDPSQYDLREYVQNPVQFVQYLYVVNNPIIYTDLLGLNPTNALLNIDWSKVIARDVPANNARGKEQYVKLNNVWRQLQTYYPDAGITSNGKYQAYTISHGGKYLQIQIQSETGNAEITTYKNNKYQSYSTSKTKIGDGYAISKRELERYFRKVWCESYYLKGMSTFEQKGVLSAIRKDINNLSTKAAQDSYRALMNFIITGSTGKYTSYATASLKVEPYTITRTEELRQKAFLQTAALISGIPLSDLLVELLSEENGDVESVIEADLIDTMAEKLIDGVVVDDVLKKDLKDLLGGFGTLATLRDIAHNATRWVEYPGTYIELLTFANGDWRQAGYLLDEMGNLQLVHLKDDKIMHQVSYSGRIGVEYSKLYKSLVSNFRIRHAAELQYYKYEVKTIHEVITTS